jgi:hypothetical protein
MLFFPHSSKDPRSFAILKASMGNSTPQKDFQTKWILCRGHLPSPQPQTEDTFKIAVFWVEDSNLHTHRCENLKSYRGHIHSRSWQGWLLYPSSKATQARTAGCWEDSTQQWSISQPKRMCTF